MILARMDGTDATSARQGFTKKLRHVPALLRKTLTYDRGKEMAEHARLAKRLAIQIFFADPDRPWQRGTDENTNGLLRRYLPKGTDLSGYTQQALYFEYHRLSVEYPTEKMPALGHATGGVYATASSFTRCTWNLKPPFQRIYSFRQSVETEQEFFLLDPLETLFIQVGYEKGVYYGPPDVDRVSGYDGWIKAITASCSAVFLLLTIFMKEEKLSRPPVK